MSDRSSCFLLQRQRGIECVMLASPAGACGGIALRERTPLPSHARTDRVSGADGANALHASRLPAAALALQMSCLGATCGFSGTRQGMRRIECACDLKPNVCGLVTLEDLHYQACSLAVPCCRFRARGGSWCEGECWSSTPVWKCSCNASLNGDERSAA